MGRWMEAINKERKVVLETTPYFLLYCSKYLPKRIRKEFPILSDLDIHSDKWIDELQILNLDTVKDLNQELSRVRRTLNLEEFIPKIDSKKILFHWTTNEYELKDINDDIDFFMSFLKKVITLGLELRIYL